MTLSRERILILTLAFLQFTHIVDFMMLMPLGPQLMRIFEIGPGEFGILVSAYTFAAGASGLFAAFFVDRYDRRRVLAFMYCGFLLGTLACGFSPDYGTLFAARVLTGAFGGVLGSQVLAIIGDTVPLERRGSAMGLVMLALSMASIAGVPAGIWAANRMGWQAPFVGLAIAGLPGLALMLRVVPSLRSHISSDRADRKMMAVLRRVFADSGQRAALAFGFLLVIGHFMVIPFLSPSFVANVGFSDDDLMYVYMFGGSATLITSPLIGKLADRVGKHRVFTIFLVLSLIPMWALTMLGPTPMAQVLVLTVSFFICANGRMVPAMALITSSVPTASRGSFMSVNSSLQQIASGTAALVGSTIITKDASGRILHFPTLAYIAIGISGLSFWASRRVRARA
ncbi:MAG: MFS transporter [Bdellovibrionales bacterium]|nr:MFS transporter [Bdellovibrionales bacterium]